MARSTCYICAGIILVIASAILPRPVAAAPETVSWKRIGTDLELARVPITGLLSAELTLVRSALAHYRLGVVRAQDYELRTATARTLCRLSRGSVCINANFFDEKGDPLGLVMQRGIMLQKVHRGGQTLTGILQLSRGHVEIVNRSEFNPSNVIEAAQAGPRLLAKSKPVPGLRDLTSLSRRAGACVDGAGRLIFYTTSGGLVGVSIGDVQHVLSLSEINCVDALNLDGGGSAQLYITGDLPGAAADFEELLLAGNDEVPVVLALWTK